MNERKQREYLKDNGWSFVRGAGWTTATPQEIYNDEAYYLRLDDAYEAQIEREERAKEIKWLMQEGRCVRRFY